MNNVYINAIASISAQATFDEKVFLEKTTVSEATVVYAQLPDYKDYIKGSAARRMAKGIKMGVITAKKVLENTNIATIDAIITGTGMGCLRDSEKFLESMLTNDEQYLTPTSFIQSTHNTVAGQIALALQCKAYNMTYVHGSVSFESALLDAQLQLETYEAKTVLLGGVDEIGEQTTAFHKNIGYLKKELVNPVNLLQEQTQGSIYGEGANFFLLSEQKTSNSFAQLRGVQLYHKLQQQQIQEKASLFLSDYKLSPSTIDVVILGYNGDVEYDRFYDELVRLFPDKAQVYYKHLSGEFHTASSFGFWLANQLLKTQKIPSAIQLNKQQPTTIKKVLLYNQYRGKDHSFILLEQC